jgi:hypothetical protein
MLFKLPQIATIVALSTFTGAFKVPEGQPDGVYAINVYTNGTEEHIRIDMDNFNSTDLAAANKKTKRQIDFPNSFVKCNPTIVAYDDWESSSDTFKAVCTFEGDTFLYPIKGYSVSYMCNYSETRNPCNPDEWNQVVAEVSEQCYFSVNESSPVSYASKIS